MAVRRLVQAGAVPITWMAVVSEWQRDWAREQTAVELAGVMAEHGGASGIAYAWEVQLLASAGKAATPGM
jgi:nicotinamidase-related amidase